MNSIVQAESGKKSKRGDNMGVKNIKVTRSADVLSLSMFRRCLKKYFFGQAPLSFRGLDYSTELMTGHDTEKRFECYKF